MEESKASLLTAWHREIYDVFFIPEFFKMDTKQSKAWTSIIDTFMTTDLTLFPEFLKTFSRGMARAPALFANKQKENYNRALHVKRLAFIIFSGKHDQYLEQVPVIQEKLVEALKANADGLTLNLICEHIFLVLRTLLVRTTPKKVEPFWPVILTEMIRIFSAQTPEPALLLAVVKFLDLALVLNSEQFNFWEWIFLQDKHFPVYHSGGENTFVAWIEKVAPALHGNQMPYQPIKRRPLVNIQSLAEMGVEGFLTYLSQFGNLVYGNCVSGAPVDHKYIEKLLKQDFLESVDEFFFLEPK